MEGYQGLSLRSSNHRQQVSNRLSIHTGLPSAPARWQTAVSTLMTRSSPMISAAVSAQSFRRALTSCTGPCGRSANCAAGNPSYRLTKEQPGTASNGFMSTRRIERRWSIDVMSGEGRDRPAHTTPIFSPDRLRRNVAQGAGSANK